jgi:saccharopine dehydrogenase (NAD+, L-lysine-forming)
MPTTFLILGGYGLAGLPLARHLLEETDVRVVLAGRSLEKAEQAAAQLNREFPGGRAAGVYADASKPESLECVFKTVDFVLVASATVSYTEAVMRAALAAGIDYLDIQYAPNRYSKLKAMSPEILQAGRCFITEAGFHPGLPAALVRHMACQFSRLESVIVGGVLNPEGGLPYTSGVDELTESFNDYQAQTFKDGRWQPHGAFDMRPIDFGPDFGRRTCYSMFFDELRPLPDELPSLRSLGFYMAGFNWMVDYAIMPGMMLALKIWPRRAVRPMGKLLCWGTQRFAAPPYGLLLKVEAAGEREGQPDTLELSAFHADGYEFTAIPVVACLLQYLDGSIRRPGLWMMGHLVDPSRLLVDMERMGIRITTHAADHHLLAASRSA